MSNVKVISAELPPKPEEPDPSECCGRGCENCVYIYYERALEKWREKIDVIESKNNV